MNLKWWSAVGAAVLGLVLAGCGSSSDSSGSASVRVANATLTHPSLDLLVNSSVASTAIASDTVSAYVGPSAGSVTLQLNDSGSGTALATSVPTLAGGNHYTLVAYESSGSVKAVVVPEDVTVPASGSVTLRIYNTAPEAGKLDVYITDPSVALANAGAPVSLTTGVSTLLTAGLFSKNTAYRVRVTAYGNKNDLRLDMPLAALADQQVATIILTPASGGALLNGAVLVQQLTYAASRNTNVRVRLAAAVGGGATVTASTGTGPIDSGVAPSFGFYTLIPATSALNITASTVGSVGAPAQSLVAGSDMTLFVYGPAGSPTASLLVDDNRPPSDTTQVKLRLINGVTNSNGALTLTANTALVGSGPVAPGAASPYTTVPGSTNAMNLTLTSSASSGTFLSNSTYTLISGSVYTVMVGDATGTPPAQFLIR